MWRDDKVGAGVERELADQRSGLPLLDRKGLRPPAAQPEDDDDARDHDGREHRRDKAERQRDGKALDGPGAEVKQQHAGDQRGEVRIPDGDHRSEEHTSELQSLMRISYAVFCLKKKKETK